VKVRAGQFQGFNSIRQLHRDTVHLNSVGQNVASWTADATIFRESSVGLQNDALDNATVSPFTNVTAISPADLLLMQQTFLGCGEDPFPTTTLTASRTQVT
jgi:hypothetical protein